MTSTRTLVLLLSAGTSLAALAVACGGKEATPTTTSSQTSAQRGEGEEAQDDGAKTGQTGGDPAPSCVHTNSGGSSGGGSGTIACTTWDEYTCTSGDATITCDCTGKVGGAWEPGSCTCGALTFAFDCKDACRIGPAEYAKCGLPAPPPSPPSGESSSSSSGGS